MGKIRKNTPPNIKSLLSGKTNLINPSPPIAMYFISIWLSKDNADQHFFFLRMRVKELCFFQQKASLFVVVKRYAD